MLLFILEIGKNKKESNTLHPVFLHSMQFSLLFLANYFLLTIMPVFPLPSTAVVLIILAYLFYAVYQN